MDDSQALLKLIAGKSNARVELGYYRGVDFPRVTVDVGGGRIPAESATTFEPEINEQVQILFVDGKPWMLGPAVPKPHEGTVVTVSGDFATVMTDLGEVVAPFPFGATLTSGEQVKLLWAGGPFIVARMSATPEPEVDPGADAAPSTTRQETFTAVQAGSFQLNGGRWSSPEPRASNGYLGAWFFGTKIRDTVPASARMPGDGSAAVEVFIRSTSRFGNAPVFAMHSQPSAGGAPDLSSGFAWNVGEGWNRLPASVEGTYFNALKGGGPALGIGLQHGGVNRFASLGADPQSGAIRITYET